MIQTIVQTIRSCNPKLLSSATSPSACNVLSGVSSLYEKFRLTGFPHDISPVTWFRSKSYGTSLFTSALPNQSGCQKRSPKEFQINNRATGIHATLNPRWVFLGISELFRREFTRI